MSNMTKPTIQVLTGHGESVTPRKSTFEWFFRCLSVMSLNVNLSEIFSSSSFPEMVFVGDPQGVFFEQKEIDDLLSFVANGGALLVLGKYGGDKRQSTNLSSLTPGLTWENTLVKSNKDNTYEVSVQNKCESNGRAELCSGSIGWATVDCPCSLDIAKETADWNPLICVNNPVWLESPFYNYNTKAYEGEPILDMSNVIAAICEVGKGRIAAVSSRYMFSNTFIGRNTSFMQGLLRLLLQSKLLSSLQKDQAAIHPDANKRLHEMLREPENLFCLLAAANFYQGVLHDSEIGNVDLGVQWCEPIWVQDSFYKCITRLHNHPRVLENNRAEGDRILSKLSPSEILSLVTMFPLNIRYDEILKVKGLCKAFNRFQAAVEAAILV